MPHSAPARWLATVCALLLAGCATVGVDEALQQTNTQAQAFTGGELTLHSPATSERRVARARELLAEPLTQAGAVQVALARSPAVQALVAQGWADIAAARQTGRPPNPLFTFERMRLGSELELDRLLSFGLVDLLLWPQRLALSRSQAAQARLQLTATVVDQVTQVRRHWVQAVAAQQLLLYAEQVQRSARASAELARRMQAAGNFSKLQRARQEVFQADAANRLAAARHATTVTREALIRALGLDDAQAAALRLPERLPDLPNAPRDARELTETATEQRLDVQLARTRLDVAGRSQGLDLIGSFTDIEVGARRDTVFDSAAGSRGTRRGFELDIRLPLFDWGMARRDAMTAETVAAAHRYDAVVGSASSQLRESYSAYRTAYDIARQDRDELVPLRQTIADENLLRYNGMLIGVFELLAEAREQITGVTQAIQSQQQFWLADAALAASVIGRPTVSNDTLNP